jgi:hypothetical protein
MAGKLSSIQTLRFVLVLQPEIFKKLFVEIPGFLLSSCLLPETITQVLNANLLFLYIFSKLFFQPSPSKSPITIDRSSGDT